MTDRELLHEYLEYTSDKAFTDLVRRHVDLVYWTCHRDAADTRVAETATQDVFSLLAHKAGSIHEGGSVVDWLFERSRMTTRNVLIREMRDGQAGKPATSDVPWKRIEPLVNDSIAGLSEMDRESLLLRIFEDRTPDEVSAEIGATEEAVATRVAHAVTSMGLQLEKRGAAVAIDNLAALLKEFGAPYASIKVEAIVETALRATPVVEKPAVKPALATAPTPPAGQRRQAPLIAAVTTIAVLAIGGLVALKLTSTQPVIKPATAPVAPATVPTPSPGTADATTQPAGPSDPFAPKPDSATGSVPLASTTPATTAPATKPVNPGARDVPTDSNGLIVGPGQPNGRVPVLPSTAPTLPSPTAPPSPVQSTPITRAPQERLMGVVTGAQPSAVMEVDGREQIVSVGATVNGGKVTEIADDHVTITSPNGQSRTVPLATSR